MLLVRMRSLHRVKRTCPVDHSILVSLLVSKNFFHNLLLVLVSNWHLEGVFYLRSTLRHFPSFTFRLLRWRFRNAALTMVSWKWWSFFANWSESWPTLSSFIVQRIMNCLWSRQLRLLNKSSQQTWLISFTSHRKPLPWLSCLSLFHIGYPTSDQSAARVHAEHRHLFRWQIKMLFSCQIFNLVPYFKEFCSFTVRKDQFFFFKWKPISAILLIGSLHAIYPVSCSFLGCGWLVKILLVM